MRRKKMDASAPVAKITDSAGASMMQAKLFCKRRKKMDASARVAKKKRTRPFTTVLFDSLESYDQVLFRASKDNLQFCSLHDLQCVLKVNGFQSCQHKKDYIEKNFSVLRGVLFQTRLSSLKAGDTVVTAVVLEDSEVVQDLAALQWLEGASKGVELSSSEEGTSLGERQPDSVSEVNLDGLSDDLVESAAAMLSLKASQPAHISSHPVEGATDLLELSANDCYRPDMSMIVMLESIQAQRSPSMCSPDQRDVLYSQEQIELMDGTVAQPEGGLLTQPSMPLFCFEEQPPQPLPPLSNPGFTGSASREEQVAQSSHTSLANVEISDDRAKLGSEAEDMIEKFQPFICQNIENSSSIMCKLPFMNGGVMKIPGQNQGTLPVQAKNHVIFEPQAVQLTQLECEEVSEVEEQSSNSSVSSSGIVEEPAQPCPPLLDSDRSSLASQENCRRAEVKSESEEKLDLVEKFAMQALELNVLHGLFEDDDLSDIELLDESASEGCMQVVANVHDFVELEEDQSSNSCQIQEVQVNSPPYLVPISEQTSSAEVNSVSFLGLLAQISSGPSSALKYYSCNLEEQYSMFNTEAKSCARRLFIKNEAEGSVEGEAARLPGRKTKKLDHSVAREA